MSCYWSWINEFWECSIKGKECIWSTFSYLIDDELECLEMEVVFSFYFAFSIIIFSEWKCMSAKLKVEISSNCVSDEGRSA